MSAHSSYNMKSKLAARLQTFPFIIWLLGFGSLVNIGGLSLLWPVNAIYIHIVLGKPMTVVGVVLMVYSAAGFLGSALGGWLFDKVGAMSVLSGALLISGLTILVPVFWPAWSIYIAVLVVFGVFSSMGFPVLSALAGQLWPAGGRRAFNFLYVSNNLGVAVGTAVGGVLAQWSFRSIFFGIAIANMVFLSTLLLVIAPRLAQGDSSVATPVAGAAVTDVPVIAGGVATIDGVANVDGVATVDRGSGHLVPGAEFVPYPGSLPVVPWVTIIILLLGLVTAWSVYVQWQSSISVYMQALGYPLTSYSLLWTLNGLLIFAVQPLVSYVTARMQNLGLQMLTGLVLYAAAFTLLWASHQYAVFVIAMVITTLGEVFVWPSVPAFVAKVSPYHRMGILQGLVQSGATMGRMLGPLGGGWLYTHVGVHGLLSFAIPFLILPGLCFLWIVRTERPLPASDSAMHM